MTTARQRKSKWVPGMVVMFLAEGEITFYQLWRRGDEQEYRRVPPIRPDDLFANRLPKKE